VNKTLLLIIPLFFSFSAFSQQEATEVLTSLLSENEKYQLYIKSVAPLKNWSPDNILRRYETYLTKANSVIRNKLGQYVDEVSLESIKEINLNSNWEEKEWRIQDFPTIDKNTNP